MAPATAVPEVHRVERSAAERSDTLLRGGAVRRELDHTERVRVFEQEALPHVERLYAAAMRYTRSPSDAEDLVQEAMTTAFRSLHQVAEGSNVRAWLYRVLHTTFLSQYRRSQRRPIEDATEDLEQVVSRPVLGADVPNAEPSAEHTALGASGPVEVRAALAALPEEQRVAVYLADVEGFAYREIADIMGTPIGTVMSRLHRGRAALRSSLGPYVERERMLEREAR